MSKSSSFEVMLAEKWDESMDPTGWWMSPKMDGLRGYWTGTKMMSRNGNTFYAPKSFTKGFCSDITLDGELWLGTGKFSETVSIVKRSDNNVSESDWDTLTYCLFDSPSLDMPYEDRIKELYKRYPPGNKDHILVLEIEQCKDRQHLEDYRQKMRIQKQEGVMLRKPGSSYKNGRSKLLLKVKDRLEADAIIIGFKPGKNRLVGMMGAITCKLPNGIEFDIGSGFTDDQRRNHPKKGAVVSFFYQELTKSGKPRFPIFIGERIDIDWNKAVISSNVTVSVPVNTIPPICPYGTSCYRKKNPDHLKNYSH